MTGILHATYLPFTREQLRGHFAPVGTDTTSADRHLAYYAKSVQAAADLGGLPPSGTPTEMAKAQKHGLQIQKDERFWVVTALMSAFHARDRVAALTAMLRRCLGVVPPVEGYMTWEQALATIGAALVAVAAGDRETLTSKVREGLGALVRRPFRHAQSAGDARVVISSGEEELAALAQATADDRYAAAE